MRLELGLEIVTRDGLPPLARYRSRDRVEPVPDLNPLYTAGSCTFASPLAMMTFFWVVIRTAMVATGPFGRS